MLVWLRIGVKVLHITECTGINHQHRIRDYPFAYGKQPTYTGKDWQDHFPSPVLIASLAMGDESAGKVM